MCSINGCTREDRELMLAMNRATAHRGPDATGVYVSDGISLGHNRLSIIDLSEAGKQPMHSVDGRYTIVFNGEIYNYRELRRELEGGYEFHSASDTEVIIAAYAAWGIAAFSKFNGIFAFALWDNRDKKLVIARDRFGVKPLYYTYEGGIFTFSSEIKALLEGGVSRELNREALAHYFRLLYVPEPQTLFSAVHSIPAGHIAVVQGASFSVEPFGSPPNGVELPGTHAERAVYLRGAVESAVRRQLVSDRPVGVYLSGGFDSSSIVASLSGHGRGVETFSVGFELDSGEESQKFNRDFELARRTSAYFGTKHHEVMIGASEMMTYLEKAVWHLDTPIANPTIVAQMKLAEATKPHVAVALSGDGGDELFGGYERYRLSVICDMYRGLVPSGARSVLDVSDRLKKLNVPPDVSRYELFMFTKDGPLSRILREPLPFDATHALFERYVREAGETAFEEVMMAVDRRTWLRDEALLRTDKTGMSAGLEVRVPLLDNELAAVAASLTPREKVSPFGTKLLFKEAFRGVLPDFLYREPKRGFFPPAAKWIRRPEVLPQVREILSPGYYAPSAKLFNWEGITSMLDAHVDKSVYNLVPLWSVLTFQIWAREYKVEI